MGISRLSSRELSRVFYGQSPGRTGKLWPKKSPGAGPGLNI
ncbi:hypothetical protein SynBMKMC1_02059 [Synechococcus sp. BMK-MC-1]|nr:hypothetical protein SynBMKMC1_02059 [Synechococcus sp. BMK-MC-1]